MTGPDKPDTGIATGHVPRILIVEDDESHAELIRRAFRRQNDKILLSVADTLSGAKIILAGEIPDVVIADLLLPDGRGIDLLPVGEEPPFPLIIMTNFGDEHVAVEAIKAGALDYVAKSVEILNDMPHIAERAMRQWEHIAERRRTEKALRESEVKYRTTFENTGNALAIIEKDTVISMVNREFEKLTGYPRDRIEGSKSWMEFIAHEKDFVRIRKYHEMRNINPENVPHSYEFDLMDSDGNEKTVVASVTMLPDADRRIASLVDITERKHAEEEKAKLLEQLRQSQKMEALGLLAGGIAHDFNNILTAIIGYANLMRKKIKDDDSTRNNLDQILSAAEKAVSLTYSLLSFSRKQPVDLKPTDLCEILTKVEKFLIRIIGEDIETKIIIPQKKIFVMADTGQIEQVLINLSTNARDAMPGGGQLTIGTECLELDEQFIRIHGYGSPGPYTLITVSDTGIGMDEAIRARIFEPFFTTKEIGKGTGLGLAIVFGIIKQHNGYISCYSEPGKGTTFRIYLPVSSATGTFHEEKTDYTDYIGKGETILLAEDEDIIRDILRQMMEEYGYSVIEAVNGEEAIRLFKENSDSIDLLFFDMVMPRKNGREAYEKICEIKPDIKIIFTSGYPSDFALGNQNLEQGVTFLSKPVQPSMLLKKLREILDNPPK